MEVDLKKSVLWYGGLVLAGSYRVQLLSLVLAVSDLQILMTASKQFWSEYYSCTSNSMYRFSSGCIRPPSLT